MTSEASFSSSHHGFWHDLLPMGEAFVRTANMERARFLPPLERAEAPPDRRGLVNELAFRLFGRCHDLGVSAASLPPELLSEEAEHARKFIETFRQHGRGPLEVVGEGGIREAVELSARLEAFFARALASGVKLEIRPPFAGCGWLSNCEGDALAAGTLYEIKAGDRSFRSADFRQMLVYCALAFASKTQDVRRVCLVNPRQGVYFSESLPALCEAMAGRSASEVLGDIVEYAASPLGGYNGG